MTLRLTRSGGLVLGALIALAPAAMAQGGFQTTDQSEIRTEQSTTTVTDSSGSQQSTLTASGGPATKATSRLEQPGQSGLTVTGGSLKLKDTSKVKPTDGSKTEVTSSSVKTAPASRLKLSPSAVTVKDSDED